MRENNLNWRKAMRSTLPAIVAVLVVAAFPMGDLSLALAADHMNLEEGIPVEIEDALPTAYRNIEIQGLFHWDREYNGDDRFTSEARLELGPFRNTQLEIDVPFLWGDAVEEDGLGAVRLGALYNFNQETLLVPAFALAGDLELPTNDESEGVDTTLKFILTKTIGRSSVLQRIHVNGSWKHNSEAEGDEREDYYVAVAGYDVRVTPDTMLIIDFVREQDEMKDEEASIVEVGLRYQLTPLTVLALGAGAGIGDESPDVRVMVGFQHSLTFLHF